MDSTLMFTLKSPEREYSPRQVMTILTLAERQGHPVEKGSYLEQMTISQIERLLNGGYDA